MITEQLAQIEAREQAATPGRWRSVGGDFGASVSSDAVSDHDFWAEEGQFASFADAEFVAHSRQDVPALLDYIRELEAAIRWLCQINGQGHAMSREMLDYCDKMRKIKHAALLLAILEEPNDL